MLLVGHDETRGGHTTSLRTPGEYLGDILDSFGYMKQVLMEHLIQSVLVSPHLTHLQIVINC